MVFLYALKEFSTLVFLAPACLGHATLGTRLSVSRISPARVEADGKLEVDPNGAGSQPACSVSNSKTGKRTV